MKQYTTPEQTAKLIELGFEKPSNTIVKEEPIYREGSIIDWKPIAEEGAYSIGELIEMLPRGLNGELLEISAVTLCCYKWMVRYPYGIIIYKNELIDALYNMCVKLKEEGVI